jgi:hypothetical protein
MDSYSYLISGDVMIPIAGKLSGIYGKKKNAANYDDNLWTRIPVY